jgi:hypothetical protein
MSETRGLGLVDIVFALGMMSFLAWILTYFVGGVPHWVQAMLFWLWVIPAILFFLLVLLVAVVL